MYSVYFLHYADYKSTTMYTCTCPSENGEGEGSFCFRIVGFPPGFKYLTNLAVGTVLLVFETLTNIDFDYGDSHFFNTQIPLPHFIKE